MWRMTGNKFWSNLSRSRQNETQNGSKNYCKVTNNFFASHLSNTKSRNLKKLIYQTISALYSLKIIVYTDWCQARSITTPLLKMNTAELDLNLARFYVEARMKKGEEYSLSTLLGFRNSIERYLNNNGRIVKISRNQVFQKSKKILDTKLRINRRAGKENIQHKPVIVSSDLAKIRASPFLSVTNPGGLLRRMWLYVSLYWCRRGREGQRDLRCDSYDPRRSYKKPSWW